MTPEQASELGRFLKDRRRALGLSTRGLAAQCRVDMATIVRLENGGFKGPRPDKLQAIAQALKLSAADLFAMAGYVTPNELPSLRPYLKAKHPELPRAALEELLLHLEQLAEQHGITLTKENSAGSRA